MKKLLLLLPLLLTACGAAADITTNEPFQIACTDKWKDGSSTEKWFIDPTLDKADSEWSYKEKSGERETDVISVSPKKIVLGEGWGYIDEKNNAGSEFAVFNRYLYTIDRFTGEMTRQWFEATSRDFPANSYMGREVPPEEEESYECEKPTR